jgi:capsular exopolysaccharide synthesis family protein
MGRIADALKRAEEERRHKQEGDTESGAATALMDPPDSAPVETHPSPTPASTAFRTALDRGADTPVISPVAAGLPDDLHESVVPYFDRSAVISEQYRSLRTRLLTQNPQNEHRIVAITSAIPREGKSVTTVNLGMIFAEIRHFKVLCVDGDFRRSRLATLLAAKPSPGLADVLRGEAGYEDIIQPTIVPNLYFVSAGETHGRSAAELLSSQRAGAMMRRFQTEFHYTFVDTPPATTVTDVGIIGQMCNGVVLLVRLNFTPEPLAQRAVRLLRVNKVPILGCLVIGHADRSVGYGYGQTYGYGYYRHDGGSRGSDKR